MFRDIVERHEITNLALLRVLIKTLLKSVAARFSANKCYKDFKSQGLAVSKNTVHSYFAHIQDAYLAFDCPLFTENLRRQNANPRKIYAIDTGLVLANTFHLNDNWGALFENLVFLDLRRQRRQVHYYLTREGHEIDFATRSIDGKLRLHQVCWDPAGETTALREQHALAAAAKELHLKGNLVTPLDYISGEWGQS
jgi:predicted AAA+ superfamily ATPase